MKKFEHEFAEAEAPIGLNWQETPGRMGRQWNEPGRRASMNGNGVLVVMREIKG